MRALSLLFAAVFSVSAAFAAQPWSLDQCIEYAVANNIDVRSRILSLREAEQAVVEAKDRFLPNLSGYSSQSFNFGRGLTADNTYANRNTSSFAVGASLSIPLFQGLSAVRGLDYARTSIHAALEQCEAAKDDVSLNVIGLYLQALYTGELCSVARGNLLVSRADLLRQRLLLEAGKIPELDVVQAEALVSNDELSLVNCQNDSVLALLDLAQLLNLPDPASFAILPVADDDSLSLLSPDLVYENALRSNHLMQAAAWSLRAAEKNVSVARAGYIPTLSLSAGLGTNYYRTSGFINEDFSQQMRHNFAKSVGFSLSVPLFDAFSTRNSVRRARIAAESARLQLESSRQQLFKSISQAYAQAVAARRKLASAQVAAASSRAAFEAMQVKYDNGRANATEYEKARAELSNALSQAIQARYESVLRTRILHFYNR